MILYLYNEVPDIYIYLTLVWTGLLVIVRLASEIDWTDVVLGTNGQNMLSSKSHVCLISLLIALIIWNCF